MGDGLQIRGTTIKEVLTGERSSINVSYYSYSQVGKCPVSLIPGVRQRGRADSVNGMRQDTMWQQDPGTAFLL
jgi:hypothetical protein